MSAPPGHIQQQLDHLFRYESGKMVAVLSRLLGMQQLETAQDIVQDTLLQAMQTWSYNGLPDNPAGWLHRVARNKAIDILRREKRFRRLAPQYASLLESEWTLSQTVQHFFLDNEIQDSQLRMMFACCHPSIPAESQVALTLKTLCGLGVHEIARAFLTGDETIAKRIYRAKEKIKAEQIEPEVPAGEELAVRLDAVLKSLYLLFNEGYHSAHPELLIREDLCFEAMRLCKLLTEHPQTALPRTSALLSLMCFQSSRLGARLDDMGNIILLKYQDRKKWYGPLIQKGFDYLDAAAEPFEESPYHLEAAIASLHAAAPSFEATNWTHIYQLYDLLSRMQPGPMVSMNKAIALGQAGKPKEALQQLLTLERLEKHHLYHACVGELYAATGDKIKALDHFQKALTLAQSQAEKGLLLRKMNLLKDE